MCHVTADNLAVLGCLVVVVEDNRFEEFVLGRGPALLRYAHALTGDASRAEDLVQDALAGLYRHWARVGHDDPYAYARRSVLHGHQGRWRRLWRWELSRAEVPDRVAVDEIDLSDRRAAVRAALDRLSAGQRAVIVLRYLEDMTEQQAADALGVSIGTVKSQAARAMARLRALGELEDERR